MYTQYCMHEVNVINECNLDVHVFLDSLCVLCDMLDVLTNTFSDKLQ